MTMDEAYEVQAEMMGREAGVNAASWFFDGNTDTLTYEAILAGIVDGDPMVLDSLPSSPLSGEWADSMTPTRLFAELGLDAHAEASFHPEGFDEVCDAYERGFSEAVEATIQSACLDYLKGAEVL